MNCVTRDKTIEHFFKYNKGALGLQERYGEIVLTKSNLNDVKLLIRKHQEYAHRKYGLPFGNKLFSLYEAKKPLNKGMTALHFRNKDFQKLEEYINNYSKAQQLSFNFKVDEKTNQDLNTFKNNLNNYNQESEDIKDIVRDINEFLSEESNYSPEITSEDNFSPLVPDYINEDYNTNKNPYVEHFNYKQSLLRQNQKYFYDVKVQIDKTDDPTKKAELIEAYEELKETLYGNPEKNIIGLNEQLAKIKEVKEKYNKAVGIKKRLQESIEKQKALGVDTTQLESRLLNVSIQLYDYKYEDLSDILEATSISDLNRAERLVESGKLENLVKAREIVNFYKLVDPNNQDVTNPYYSRKELLSDKVSSSVLEDLKNISDQAERINNKINNKSRGSILDYINSLNYFLKKNNNNPFVEEDVFKDEDGLMDISLLDDLINNIQDNPHSRVESVLMSAIWKRLEDGISLEQSKVKEISDEFDKKNPEVVKELLRLGHRLADNPLLGNVIHRVLGGLVNSPDFSIFKQVSTEGTLTNKLVQRESDKYRREIIRVENAFKEDMYDFLNGNRRNDSQEAIYHRYHNRIRVNSEIIKPHLLEDIVSNPAYSVLLDNNTTVQIDDTYKNSLIAKLGPQGYQDILDQQKKGLDSFLIARDRKIETMKYIHGLRNNVDPATLELSDLDASDLEDLTSWQIDHNPFYNGLLFENNSKVRTSNRRYNNYQLDYTTFIPRTNKTTIARNPRSQNNIPLNLRPVTLVETTENNNYYDDRYKYIEDNPILYDFWKTAMKSSEYIKGALETSESENWDKGDLPIDESVNIERFQQTSDKLKDKIFMYFSKNFRNILKNIYTSMSSTMDLPFGSYNYGEKALTVNTANVNIGTKVIENEVRLKRAELKNYLLSNGFTKYKDVINVDNVPESFLKEALYLYGVNPNSIKNVSIQDLKQKYINTFNIEQNSNNIYTTNVIQVLEDLHTQNALKQTNGDLGLSLLKSTTLASGIIARKKNVDLIQFMVDAYNNIKLTDSNSFGISKLDPRKGKKVLKSAVRENAVRQMQSFVTNALTLRGKGSDNRVIVKDLEEANNLQTSKTERFLLGTGADLDLIDDLLNSDNLSEQDKEELLKIKLQKIRYFDGVKSLVRPISQLTRMAGLGVKTISNMVNLYEGNKAILIHDATGQDWTPGMATKALGVMKGAFARNFLQVSNEVANKLAPEASKAKFIIDRLDYIEDASTLEAKALKKHTVRGKFKDLALTAINPYILIKKGEYINQGSVALALLMSENIKDKNGNVSSVWDALDIQGKLKPEFRYDDNLINTWEKFNTQEAFDFKSRLNSARNKTSGDYTQIGESRANTHEIGKAVLNFKKWMPKYVAQMYGHSRYDYNSGKNISGRFNTMHPLEMMLYRIGSAATIKGFGTQALWAIPLMVGDWTRFNKIQDIDSKPKLKDSVDRLSMMFKVATKTAVGLPINLVGTGLFLNKPIIDTHSDKMFGKSLEQKLLDKGVKPEDIGNIRAMGVELGFNMLTIAALLLIYGTMMAVDDDEDKSLGFTKTEWGNIAQNSIYPLLQQGNSWVSNPLDAFNSVNNIPMATYLEQLSKSSERIDKVLMGLQRDYIATGTQAGTYGSDKTLSKLVPLPFRDLESKKDKPFKEWNTGQLFAYDQLKISEKLLKNARSEYKHLLDEQVTEENLESMYDKFNIEYKPTDKEDNDIPFDKLKDTFLKEVMKTNFPKPNKGNLDEAYEDFQKVLDNEFTSEQWRDKYYDDSEEVTFIPIKKKKKEEE